MSEFVVLASGLAFPEGPTVAADGAIWCSELSGGRIARIDADATLARYDVGGAPNGLAIAPDRSVWFCDAGRNLVRRLDPSDGATETMIESIHGEALAAPNDLAFHVDGTLVFTCPGESRRDPIGYICRRSADGVVDRVADGLLFPNGICFSADGERVFVAETYACRVVAGRWDDTAPLDLSPIFDTPGPIGADGVAVDARGRIFTCVYGAGLVRVADSVGRILRDIPIPDPHPAGCSIDPLGRWSLIVTGSSEGVVLGLPVEKTTP